MELPSIEASEYAKRFDLTHVFIKFIDEDYVSAFMEKGELHFENFAHFNKLTDGESGDPNEGSVALTLKQATATLKLLNYPGNPVYKNVPIHDAAMQYGNEKLKAYGLTSMFYVNQLDGFQVEQVNEENYPNAFAEGFTAVGQFNKDVWNQFASFLKVENNKTKVPVLIFPNNFMKHLKKANIPVKVKPVQYYSIDEVSFFEKIRKEAITETLFAKTNDYSHQKEYRIVLTREIPDEGENVYLGSMEDCAVKLEIEKIKDLRFYYRDSKETPNNKDQ